MAETRVRSAAKYPTDGLDAFAYEHGDMHEPGEGLEAEQPTGDSDDILCVVWRSRSQGDPHFVTIIHDPRGRRLQCVCTSAAIRGDCWAVEKTRRLFGWPEPERT
jgi:hypothetical protein